MRNDKENGVVKVSSVLVASHKDSNQLKHTHRHNKEKGESFHFIAQETRESKGVAPGTGGSRCSNSVICLRLGKRTRDKGLCAGS